MGKPTFYLIRAGSCVFAFYSPSTPISLPPLPPLATFLDTLDGPNSTGLTNCMKRGARRTDWSWFYYNCIGSTARLGKVALGLKFALALATFV
jgi:hypothetical protein